MSYSLNLIEKQYEKLLKSVVDYEFFIDIHDFVELLESDSIIKSFIDNEAEKYDKCYERMDSRSDLTNYSKNAMHDFEIIPNLWFEYGSLRRVHDGIESLRNPKSNEEVIYLKSLYDPDEGEPKGADAYKETLKKVYEKITDFLNRTKEFESTIIKETKTDVIDKPKNKGIFYNSTTGIGWANGKKFKFKDHQPEFALFKVLISQIDKPVKKDEVVAIIRSMGKGKEADPTLLITKLVTKIRKKTKLSTCELVQNNGNITLSTTKLDDYPNQP